MSRQRLLVVMPTRNQAAFIERAIASVVAQLGEADTFVVVDGGSNDGTHEVLQKWQSRITKVMIEPGTSQAEALALGFAIGEAEYACYLNSDDLLLPGAVGKALTVLERGTADAVYSHRVFVDEIDRVTHFWSLPRHNNYLMKRWDYIPQETCFWRYDVMQQAGGVDTTLRFAVDYDLFVRMMQIGTFWRCDDFFGAFRIHPHSKTVQQNESVGKPEVAALQTRYGVNIKAFDMPVGTLLREWIALRSKWMRRERGRLQAEINRVVSAVS